MEPQLLISTLRLNELLYQYVEQFFPSGGIFALLLFFLNFMVDFYGLFSEKPPFLVLCTHCFWYVHVLWVTKRSISTSTPICDIVVWGEHVLRKKRIWITFHRLDNFTSIVCYIPICSCLMSDTSTVSSSDGRILLHPNLKSRNVMRNIFIDLDADISIQVATPLIYSIWTTSRMEYG